MREARYKAWAVREKELRDALMRHKIDTFADMPTVLMDQRPYPALWLPGNWWLKHKAHTYGDQGCGYAISRPYQVSDVDHNGHSYESLWPSPVEVNIRSPFSEQTIWEALNRAMVLEREQAANKEEQRKRDAARPAYKTYACTWDMLGNVLRRYAAEGYALHTLTPIEEAVFGNPDADGGSSPVRTDCYLVFERQGWRKLDLPKLEDHDPENYE